MSNNHQAELYWLSYTNVSAIWMSMLYKRLSRWREHLHRWASLTFNYSILKKNMPKGHFLWGEINAAPTKWSNTRSVCQPWLSWPARDGADAWKCWHDTLVVEVSLLETRLLPHLLGICIHSLCHSLKTVGLNKNNYRKSNAHRNYWYAV